MRQVRFIGLCLAAIFVIAAFGASSAFAGGPEFGKCEAKAGGKYKDANCQTKGKPGAFEWVKETALPNKAFHGEGGAGILNVVARFCEGVKGEGSERTLACEEKGVESSPIQIECETEGAHGEYVGTKEVTNIAVTFRGCKLFGSVACENGLEGEVRVDPLKGTLGYINKGTKSVGISLTPKTKKGEFAKFTCGGFLGVVVGADPKVKGESNPVYPGKGGGDSIISPIEPVNTMTTSLTQTYTTTSEDENIPNKFEGKPIDVLESYAYNAENPVNSQLWSKAGEVITNVNHSDTAGEEGEIKG